LKRFRFAVDAGEVRLDAYLAGLDELGLSRSHVKKLVEQGLVTVGGRPAAKAGHALKPGDDVEVTVPDPGPVDLAPEPIPLDVLYEDEDLVVVNKPRDLVVHPAAGHWSGTLVNALLEHVDDLEGVGGELRPGIVHRLDKDTTGVLVVAKNDRAHQSLSEQIRERTAKREYWALVHGAPGADAGRIEAPIGRHRHDRKRMAVIPGAGRDAITHFRVLERLRGYSLLACRLETGRTHQIRVHLAYIGHPVVGDPTYGTRRQHLEMTAQALHARTLGFHHPATGTWMEFEAPLPNDFEQALDRLRKEGADAR
jgi:23S rRNA pseudouridine1911/1915/1917 synthase